MWALTDGSRGSLDHPGILPGAMLPRSAVKALDSQWRKLPASAKVPSIHTGTGDSMSTKIFIGCVWAVGLVLLLAVLGSRDDQSSIEIWMWTAGITGLCWVIAKVIRDRAGDDE